MFLQKSRITIVRRGLIAITFTFTELFWETNYSGITGRYGEKIVNFSSKRPDCLSAALPFVMVCPQQPAKQRWQIMPSTGLKPSNSKLCPTPAGIDNCCCWAAWQWRQARLAIPLLREDEKRKGSNSSPRMTSPNYEGICTFCVACGYHGYQPVPGEGNSSMDAYITYFIIWH